MAIRISDNTSLQAQRNLSTSQAAEFDKVIAKLSSGQRTARSQDSFSVANHIRDRMSQAGGIGRNANDGISLTQVADGGLNEVNDNLQRMRQLATQAANNTNADDRQALQQELTQRNDEIDRIASNSQFNGQNLLDGSFSGSNVQIGDSNTVAISGIANTQASALGRIEGNESDQGLRSIDLSTEAGAKEALARIDRAIGSVADSRSAMGASQNRMSEAIANVAISNTTEAQAPRSQFQDIDGEQARALSALLSNQIPQQGGIAILSQANQVSQMTSALLRG